MSKKFDLRYSVIRKNNVVEESVLKNFKRLFAVRYRFQNPRSLTLLLYQILKHLAFSTLILGFFWISLHDSCHFWDFFGLLDKILHTSWFFLWGFLCIFWVEKLGNFRKVFGKILQDHSYSWRKILQGSQKHASGAGCRLWRDSLSNPSWDGIEFLTVGSNNFP